MLMAAEWSRLNRFPLGRIAFSLESTAKRAMALPEPLMLVAELARHGAEAARQGLELESEFRSITASRGRFPPRTRTLDRRLDRCMVGFDGFLVSQATMFAHLARGQAAQRLSTSLYPEGVTAIIRLPYTAQHARISVLLRKARSPELADDVAELPELALMLAELESCNDAYGEALREVNDRPTGNDVRAARTRCQEFLAATVSLIFGLYGLADPDRMAERDHLLEPILDQNAAVREARRRNTAPSDADPDTGIDLGTGVVDTDVDTALEAAGVDELPLVATDAAEPGRDDTDPIAANTGDAV